MRSISRFCLVMLVAMALLPVEVGCSRKRDPSRPAPVNKFAEEMNGYIGGPIANVMARFGIYSGMMELEDGRTLYEWNDRDLSRNIFSGLVQFNRCDVRVVMDTDGLVESWNSNGNCR